MKSKTETIKLCSKPSRYERASYINDLLLKFNQAEYGNRKTNEKI